MTTILNIDKVSERTSLSKRHIHNMVRRGEFPAPIVINGSRKGWLDDGVEVWIKKRIAEARTEDRNLYQEGVPAHG